MAPSYRVGRRLMRPSWVLGTFASYLAALVTGGVIVLPAPAFGQQQQQPPLSADEQAALVLNAARRAFDDGKYNLAADGFRQFLSQHANHKDAPAAAYGLGLSLLQQPQRDYPAAIDALQKATAAADLPDRPFALYYLGLAHRGIGNRSLAEIASKPAEEKQLRDAARPKFEEAAKQFTAAQEAFEKRAKGTKVPDKGDLPADVEWAARARCDRCEMLLQAGKYTEAADAAGAFQSDKVLARSRYRPLGLYHLGYARFALKDYRAAGRALSQLAPFTQEFGPHARFLLARVHHLSDERPEAAAQYKAVIEGFDAQKKAAQAALRDPSKLDPDRKATLEAVANGPRPDYVTRATFYGAVLQADAGQFGEAGDALAKIAQQQAKTPLGAEAQLRLGWCRLQQKNAPEAIKALGPLRDHAQFGDRAQWWLARARLASADPNNPQAQEQAARDAVEALRKAADKAGQMAAADPEAKARRGDILIELADTQQLAKQYKEAAATYGQVLSENLAPDRAEEATERRVAALHLAAQYQESNDLAAQFKAKYPRSTLMPSVLFREAENAYLTALAAADDAAKSGRDAKEERPELEKRFGDAIERYQKLIDKYPDFEYVDHARQAMAIAHHRLGRYDQAAALLEKIPEASRTGELATVPYLLADCYVRGFPPDVDDALQANRLIDNAEQAAKLLEAFVAAQPKTPQTPDALLKLGHCYQRIGVLLLNADEKRQTLQKARESYDKCQQQFGNDPAVATAVFERARCLAAAGDIGGAVNDLKKFQDGPFRTNPNAPLAMLRLATLLRAQNNPDEAAKVIRRCRDEFEPALLKDPARAEWVPMLQYEHALALKQSKKTDEARQLFERVAKDFADQPAGVNAAWRVLQAKRETLIQQLTKARAVAARPGVKTDEVEAAYAGMSDGLKALADGAAALRERAGKLGQTPANAEPRQAMLYELAWCNRLQADVANDLARQKMQRESADKVRSNLARQAGSEGVPVLAGAQLPASATPLAAAEKQARDDYQSAIKAAPASTLAAQSRYELADLLIARGEYDPALEQLAAALENGPAAETAERVKLRIAACCLAKGDAKNALAQAKGVLLNPKSALAPEARYLVGEALVQQKEWNKAIEALTPFRDQDPFRGAAGVADRALLRLGDAFAQLNNWDAGRQAYEQVVARSGQDPWADEARYGMGWALQNQKRYDEAANAYAEVMRRTASEVAARAQYNLGVCRAEQKRPADAIKALLAVGYTYDYPDWTAAALCKAAEVQLAEKQPDEARKLWQRVVKEYGSTRWAPEAQKRLAELK
jgi:TolA-binding protein